MNKEKFLNTISRFPGVKALVIGDIMLDIYEYCLTEQSKILHSEKPGKRAYRPQKVLRALGGAGNVAANLASLGVKTLLAGVAGNDGNYFKLCELCEENNISHFIIRDFSRPTTVKTRLYIDDEYILRKDEECDDKIDAKTTAAVMKEISRAIQGASVVILSDYNKGVFTEDLVREIIKECGIRSIPVVVDFKPVNNAIFRGVADVIAPNESEAKELMPGFLPEKLEDSTLELHNLLGCKSTIVTLGENGLSGCDSKTFFHIPGHKVEAQDAVGCGDTARAGIALGLALGLNIKEAAELANFAAALIVQKPNTSCVTPEELMAFIEERI